MTILRVSYVPLVDAGLLILARELGLDRRHGVTFELSREGSWAAVRDKIVYRQADAAHLLAPAALALSSGLATPSVALSAPIGLGLNGNAIVVSAALADDVARRADGPLLDPAVTARAVRSLATERASAGEPALRFGTVFMQSAHTFILRHWLGIAADSSEIALQVVPPPFVNESLRRGLIDGYCVGAPWPQEAMRAEFGRVLHLGVDIIPDCPEKWFVFRRDDVEADRLPWREAVAAIQDAAAWLATEGRLEEATRLILRGGWFDAHPDAVMASLTGRTRRAFAPRDEDVAGALRLDPDAIRPDPAHEDVVRGWLADGLDADAKARLDAAARILGPGSTLDGETAALV